LDGGGVDCVLLDADCSSLLFSKHVTPEETFRQREAHLMRSIEHCVSVIALCRVSNSYKAELSYELALERLTDELRTLRAEWESLHQIRQEYP
jgi:hypothetical protein